LNETQADASPPKAQAKGATERRDDMRKLRSKIASKRISGQELMVAAVGSSVLIWAGVLNYLLV
jgi:hypothetical protein